MLLKKYQKNKRVMNKYTMLIQRLGGNEKETIGDLYIYEDGKQIFNCYTLELGDHQNQRRISRINAGKYWVEFRTSEKYGDHFILLDVEERDYILIHSGNFFRNTKGCILVGEKISDIDADGFIDVTKSKPTLAKMRSLLPSRFELTIKDI